MTKRQMRNLKPGRIIVSPSGTRRTVLAVHVHGTKVYVTVPILHCSWTHRGYTILDKQMLKSYSVSRGKIDLKRHKLAKKIIQDAAGCERFCDCCEVVGVFR